MAISKGGKVVVAILAGVATLGAGFAIAYKVSDDFKAAVDNAWKDFSNKFKSEEKKNEERKDQIKEDERLEDFDDEKKDEIVDKFDKITESDEYKDMTDKEKDELVDKLIESEKLQQDVQKEQEEYESKKEENKQQLESLTNSQQELEQKVQDLKDSGASDEEIKAAEEEQQKVEEQIKTAEQEKIYYETVDTVVDITANNEVFNYRNPGTSIRKMYGIYKFGGRVYINADIIQTEIIGGVEIVSSNNALCAVNTFVKGDESYDQILKNISGTDVVSLLKICSNKNAESHKEFFEQNKYSIDPSMQKGESKGYSFSVVESWENGDSNHPEYIIKGTRDDQEYLFIITYSDGQYSSQTIKKICPEFWAQVEAEQAQQAAESDVQAQSVRSSFATYDEKGEVTSFDFTAYREHMNKQKTPVEQDLATATNEIFPDFDFSL